MDIVQFVNSRDIRRHLIEIGYQFNTVEAAWLIYQCRNKTLEEKFLAWEEIIVSMPDCKIDERSNCMEIESLHDFLREYIELQRKLVDEFQKEDGACIYRFSIKWGEDRILHEDGCIYSSYEKCLKAAQEECEGDTDEVDEMRIEKVWIDTDRKSICVYMNEDCEILGIMANDHLKGHEADVCDQSFEGLWFDLPTPFKKGDIVVDPKYPEIGLCRGPFVLTSINLDKDAKAYQSRLLHGDISDMNARGYFLGDSGMPYFEVMWTYMDCEYYRGEFTGKKRILKALSSYIKKEIDESLFAYACHRIMMEGYVNDLQPNWFTDEGLKLAGLK